MSLQRTSSKISVTPSIWRHLRLPDGYRDQNLEIYNNTKTPIIDLRCGEVLEDSGDIWKMPIVKQLEVKVIESMSAGYSPTLGYQSFTDSIESLLFPDRTGLVSAQCIGGAGALSLAAGIIKPCLNSCTLYLSNESWADHSRIFEREGFKIKRYTYLNSTSNAIDLNRLLEDLQRAEHGSAVLLQSCAHNPTGIVPKLGEWARILAVCQDRQLLPIFDLAYMGLGKGLEMDLAPIRLFKQAQIDFILATSLCKIFSSYAHRVGALTIYSNDNKHCSTISSNLKIEIRNRYSSPPVFGAALVTEVLNGHLSTWLSEVEKIRSTIEERRHRFTKLLIDLDPLRFVGIENQNGLFCWTGLSKAEVQILAKNEGIYLPSNARLSLGQLTSKLIVTVAQAIYRSLDKSGSKVLTLPNADIGLRLSSEH
jgi:aspartate/tyrosine/aromatic aminotransferase